MLYEPVQRPKSTKEKNRADRWREYALWSALAAALLLIGTCLLLYSSDLILPGVRVAGLLEVAIGGKLQSQAAADVAKAWQDKTLTLRANDTTWTAAAASLGLELDVETTIQLIHRQSRSLRGLSGWLSGKPLFVTPALYLDREAMTAALNRLAAQVAIKPVNATIRIREGRVEAVPAVPGRELDVAATAAWLEQSMHQVVAQGTLDLTTRATPAAVSDASALVQLANQWLANSLSIHLWDPISDETTTWTVGPEEWVSWMSLRTDAGSTTGLAWTLDTARTQASLETHAAALPPDQYLVLDQAGTVIEQAIADGSWAARLRVYHTARQYVVEFGETISSIARDYGIPYPWILQANPSVSDALAPGQIIAIPSPDALLPLPIVENKRIIVSISRQWMWVYENGALLWECPISTGIASSPTSPGVFQIQTHDENAYAASWDLWMPYFMGIYRPVPTANFMNGFHGFPTRDGATLLWTGNLGYPVTYGCILLDTGNAAVLYEWAEEGVLVEIR